MSSKNCHKELNDLELEMKSNNISNSDIVSIDDDIRKKEIKYENGKLDSFTEIQFIQKEKDKNIKEDNIDNKNMIENKSDKNNDNSSTKDEKSTIDNKKDIFGDLTSIIKNKIQARNEKENKKKKKLRLLSAPSKISIEQEGKEKDYSVFSLTTKSKNSKIEYNISNKIKKANSSVPKNSNIKKIKKPKKNPELFINKKIGKNDNNTISINNGNLTTKRDGKKKINFNDVLKRFDEEKKTAQKRFDNKKKELKEKENMIYTGKPKITKKNIKSDKYSKDFLIRQKELNDNLNTKKEKLIEEENKKKEKEYQKIISDSIILKKMKKYKRHKSDDQWVNRLYKDDVKKRELQRDILKDAFLPSFRPYLPPKKHLNKSVDKANEIEEVLDKYKKRQNPQLLLDYLSKNNLKLESGNLFRQKIFSKFGNRNKKLNNSMDINLLNSDEDSD